MRIILATAALVALAGLPATLPAQDALRFDASNSSLGFEGRYGGEPVPGVFRSFSGRVVWSPTDPLATRFEVEIDVGSLDTDYPDRDEVLKDPDWFDVASYPTARWVSTAGCTLAEGALVCPGELTIRGTTREVPIRVEASADGRVLSGRARINRRDFGVGGGDWDDASMIDEEVAVTFTLRPAF
jgi:polyisoprenoid-binding protein YceI